MNQFTKGISTALFCIAILTSSLLFSCQKQSSSIKETPESKKIEFIKNGISVYYLANLTAKELSFNLLIRNKEEKVLINEDFIVNTSELGLGKRLTSLITKKSKEIAEKLSTEEILAIEEAMDLMLAKSTYMKKRAELLDLRVQGLFVSNSLLKATKRAKEHLLKERNAIRVVV